jgi:hypothetical protein
MGHFSRDGESANAPPDRVEDRVAPLPAAKMVACRILPEHYFDTDLTGPIPGF